MKTSPSRTSPSKPVVFSEPIGGEGNEEVFKKPSPRVSTANLTEKTNQSNARQGTNSFDSDSFNSMSSPCDRFKEDSIEEIERFLKSQHLDIEDSELHLSSLEVLQQHIDELVDGVKYQDKVEQLPPFDWEKIQNAYGDIMNNFVTQAKGILEEMHDIENVSLPFPIVPQMRTNFLEFEIMAKHLFQIRSWQMFSKVCRLTSFQTVWTVLTIFRIKNVLKAMDEKQEEISAISEKFNELQTTLKTEFEKFES